MVSRYTYTYFQVASDFAVKYVPFGFSRREPHYKLTDPFCIFYLRFLK